MPSIRQLVDDERTIDLDLGKGMTVHLTYNPQEITYTPEEIEARRDSDDASNANAEEIARSVIAWDVTGPVPVRDKPGHPAGSLVADGQPIPLDAEIIGYLPFEFVYNVALALNLDGQVDPTKMQKKLQRRGSTRTSMKTNGRQDEPSPSLSTSVST